MISVSAGEPCGAAIGRGWYLDVIHFAQRTPWLHGALTAYTDYGLVLFILLLVMGWWTARRADLRVMASALWAPVAVLLAYGISNMIKLGVHEPRPCRTIPGISIVASCDPLSDYSFPSNHAVLAASAAVALLVVNRWLGAIATVLALLMGFTRVYVGAHYPHDVLIGLALGALIGCTGILAGRLLADPVRRLRNGRMVWLVGSGE